MTEYEKTSCSQCGAEFGPGDSGYSHCEDHRGLSSAQRLLPRAERDIIIGRGKYAYSFSFEPGCIEIKTAGYGDRNGSGHIAFDEENVDWEPKEDRDGSILVVRVEKSEWLSIRDFLNKRFPVPSEEDND